MIRESFWVIAKINFRKIQAIFINELISCKITETYYRFFKQLICQDFDRSLCNFDREKQKGIHFN